MATLPIEMTKSRTGKHMARRIAVLYMGFGERRVVLKPEKTGGRGIYSRGTAGTVELPPDTRYAVLFTLVRNMRGHVSGTIEVYDGVGNLLLRARLRKRKVRRVKGDPSLSWLIEDALAAIGLDKHVRRVNMRTGER